MKLTKERIGVMRRSHNFSATPGAEFEALCDLALASLEPKGDAALRELLEECEADRQNLMGDGCTNDALGLRIQAALSHPSKAEPNGKRCNQCGRKGYKGDWSECFTVCEVCWPVEVHPSKAGRPLPELWSEEQMARRNDPGFPELADHIRTLQSYIKENP